ncbi:MAG: hypothetical protein IKP79_03375, partial [Bacilli bacterium]|nr:hypothetical protein [Bacilli bacterium]
ILFSRVLINLKIGINTFTIPYDTALFSNRNELLLLLNENNQSNLRKTLDRKNIEYHEVLFQEETYEHLKPQPNKKIIFARGINSLRETLKESKKSGKKECVYYPHMRGKLNLKYYLRDDSKESLTSKEIKGLIELEDKIILCLNQDEDRNLNYRKILYAFDDLGMIVSIKDDVYYESIRRGKEYIK